MHMFTSPALWFSFAALLVIVEVLSGTMIAACLAAGCVVSGVMALMGFGFTPLIAGLIAGTLAAFVGIVPLVRHFRSLNPKSAAAVSGMEALTGREARVTEAIAAGGTGRVRIDGDNWQARSVSGCAAEIGARVRVTGHESIVLLVEGL